MKIKLNVTRSQAEWLMEEMHRASVIAKDTDNTVVASTARKIRDQVETDLISADIDSGEIE